MFIQTEITPNPNTLKFIPGHILLDKGSYDFDSIDAAAKSPLALRMFHVEGVTGVFIGEDFISITKAEDKDWDVLKPHILSDLMDHLVANKPVILENNDAQQAEDLGEEKIDYSEEEQKIVEEIKELLDSRVRPAVAVDGGDIIFNKFVNGVVYLKMRGACSGCPSSTVTLKNGIENMLRYYIPEVVEVKQVD
jgi:Fe-S cluster biogenesis protein NfuA